jgi:hypothetical protein
MKRRELDSLMVGPACKRRPPMIRARRLWLLVLVALAMALLQEGLVDPRQVPSPAAVSVAACQEAARELQEQNQVPARVAYCALDLANAVVVDTFHSSRPIDLPRTRDRPESAEAERR